MPIRRITAEHALYLFAFVIGCFFRLYNLGSTPLSDYEASHALQALAQPLDAKSISSVSPAYIILTRATFDIFGSSDLLARWWPALAGSFLVFAPLFFRRELGQKAALILAFGLALDPGLVAISRLAGGPMMAIVFTFFALGWMRTGYPTLGGILAASALLSGSTSIIGISILLIVWGITRLLRIPHQFPESISDLRSNLRPALYAAGITFLAAGMFFMFRPADLGSIVTGMAEYFTGWASASEKSAVQMLFMLLIYAPLPFLFILTQVFFWLIHQSFSDESIKPPPVSVLLWLTVSILIVFIYPGKQAWDLGWIIIPMWVFTAQTLSQMLPEGKPHVISLILAGTIFTLLALFWNTLVSSRQIVTFSAFDLPENVSRLLIQLILFIGVIGLGGLSALLVSLGWSPKTSRDGLVIGLTAGFVFYSISAMWGVSQLRQNRPEELWSPAPAAGQVGLFLDTIHQVSEQDSGFGQTIDILSLITSPSMRWALRDFPRSGYANGVPPGESPSIVVTQQEGENPTLEAAYRGQDFSWSVAPGWSGDLPVDLLAWLVARQAPVIEKQVILWVRNDLFPGEQVNSAIE
ncbi:MAG: hypothetical protein A2Z16_08660 [Chloroflexi bacterium RBG_16_54_18]|nr:MAG: hypothetical protein A2Z16_08660 [Chloroflexi bacterium RBG_16_54_18]